MGNEPSKKSKSGKLTKEDKANFMKEYGGKQKENSH